MPTKRELDFPLAFITYTLNLCSSTVFFFLVANSSCPVTEARIQGTVRILAVLGIPILVYSLIDDPPYNIIIAQPVMENEIEMGYGNEIEIGYNNEIEMSNNNQEAIYIDNEYEDIEV